jgi:hypothetical protein
MALSLQTSRALRELLGTEENVVGFSEDEHEGGAVRVYVEDVARADALPASIAGHVVHYVEVGVPQKISHAAPAVVDVNPRTKVRPLVGGVSIAPLGVSYSGTLGYFVLRDDKVGVLSCAHVLPDGPEKRVLQQSVEDGGTNGDVVARLAASVDDGHTVDCAYAVIEGAVKHELEVNAIGRVAGSRPAKRDELTRKSGRTTKVTDGGKITDINATITIGPDTYTGQILVETSARFAAGGDSGSLLIADSDVAGVGLIMATNVPHGTKTWANHIGAVEAALGVRLA